MAVAISALVQNVYPPRVAVALTGLTLGDQLIIYREVAGARSAIRGGQTDSATDTGFITIDAELPFGVPVRYIAVVEGVEYTAGPATYDLPAGNVVLTDAITGAASEVKIVAIGEKTYARKSARFSVAGRNIVVSGPQGQAEGSYQLHIPETSSRGAFMNLMATATEGIVQIRQPGISLATEEPYDGIDGYLAVDRITEARHSQDGSDPRRLMTIEFAEVFPWADELEARTFSLGDIADYIGVSGTLQDIADFNGVGGTLLDIAQADWS